MRQQELVREAEDRVKRNNSFNKDKWLAAISVKTVSNPRLKEMILNYFVSEGYETAAACFAKEAGLTLGERKIEIIRIKDRIRHSLQMKDVDKVKAELAQFNPEILAKNDELVLQLDLVTFRHMVQNQEFEDALEYIRKIGLPHLEKNQNVGLIEEHLLLLSLKDPSKSPSSELLMESRLLDLNSRINKELNHRMDPEIIAMMKLMKWMEKRLDSGVKVPKLQNLSKLQFSLQ